MNVKIGAIVIVLAMLSMAGFVAIHEESDATAASDNVNIYYTEDLTRYTTYTTTGYNLSDALNNSGKLSELKSTIDNNFSKQYTNEYGTYTSINDEWGKITRTSEITDGYVWNVFVYTYDGTNDAGQWKIADKTLGFYKPYDDYDKSYATANVILYYGVEQTEVPAILPSGLAALTVVSGDSFEFTFIINDGSQTETLTGCGSDAALALIDAVGEDVSLSMTPGVSYGYLISLYDLATEKDASGNWHWWNMSNNTYNSSTLVTSQFYLGFYIPFGELSISCDTISLSYA